MWIFVGWYRPDWYLDLSGINCTSEEMKKALDGHFTLDFIQFQPNYSAVTLVGKTVKEIIDDFRAKRSEESMDIPLNRTFSLYQAYGYDAVLSIARMLDRVAAGDWPNDTLSQSSYRDLRHKLKREVESSSFEFEGLTVRVVGCSSFLCWVASVVIVLFST